MNDLELDGIATGTRAESVPAIVSTLIANAVATFDADRKTSRSYLLRASAILRACAPHGGSHCRRSHSRGGLAQWQLNRVVDYIEEHLADRITGEKLASLIGVSVGQLFRAFKATVGIPPLHYVVSRRVEFACSLLRTTHNSLSQIAIAAGFCDQAHLCRVFRRVLATTPAAWRRANGSEPKPSARGQRSTLPARRSPDRESSAGSTC